MATNKIRLGTKNLFQAINCSAEFADTRRTSRINKTRRLLHINLLVKKAMKKGIFLRPAEAKRKKKELYPVYTMSQHVFINTAGHLLKHAILGDYVKDKVPSLKPFLSGGKADQEHNIPSLAALSSAMRLLQRYEFKISHGEWVCTAKPDLGPGISERVWEALKTTDINLDICHSVKTELRAALIALLGDFGVLAIPTVPGPPPKLQTDPGPLETFRARAFSLLSIGGVSGFCQVSIPLGLYDNLPVAISLLAKHGSDGFLLNLVKTLYDTLQNEIGIAEGTSY